MAGRRSPLWTKSGIRPLFVQLGPAGYISGLTALQTLDWLALSAGERLLVAGASGAVGGIALQLARMRGVRVDALVARESQLEVARDHGAQFATADPGALDHRGYDAVFDTCGAFVTDAVADGGRYASIDTQAGPVPDLSARKRAYHGSPGA